jgi:hypothetical protein
MWTIQPLIGIAPLRFGMSQAEVAALPEMGPPLSTQVDTFGLFQEFRELGRPMCDYREGRIVSLAVDHHVNNVSYEGLDVFGGDPRTLLLALRAANGGA